MIPQLAAAILVTETSVLVAWKNKIKGQQSPHFGRRGLITNNPRPVYPNQKKKKKQTTKQTKKKQTNKQIKQKQTNKQTQNKNKQANKKFEGWMQV